MDFRIFLRIFKTPTLMRIILPLSIICPGIITSSVNNDAGGIATYSLAGSQFGYTLLWILIPLTIILAMFKEMGVRMGIVSKKGLSDLIRENMELN